MTISREEIIWAYRCFLGREPESEAIIEAHRLGHHSLAALRNTFFASREFASVMEFAKSFEHRIEAADGYKRDIEDNRPTILVQNYHKPATTALIRDFQRIGLRPISPDSNWFYSKDYEPNAGLGAELISFEDYLGLPRGRIFVAHRGQEYEMTKLAEKHGDTLILNVAEHHNYYRVGISNILISPDIITYENYPDQDINKLLYFFRPHLSDSRAKDIKIAFGEKLICSFINNYSYWPRGNAALEEFRKSYPHTLKSFGKDAPDGSLDHASCNKWMRNSMFTVHFKEMEAYGLTCLESMLIGTPVITLREFMADKTLGRYFLDDNTAIFVDHPAEAAQRAVSMSFETYAAMSRACQQRVEEMTSEHKTVDRLKALVFSSNGRASAG